MLVMEVNFNLGVPFSSVIEVAFFLSVLFSGVLSTSLGVKQVWSCGRGFSFGFTPPLPLPVPVQKIPQHSMLPEPVSLCAEWWGCIVFNSVAALVLWICCLLPSCMDLPGEVVQVFSLFCTPSSAASELQ